ncbi:MAG: dethiobiotin synthase [Opitutales bacterium]
MAANSAEPPQTYLITGHDTGIGKSWVTACFARELVAAGKQVQVIKPVETGVATAAPGDAEWIGEEAARAGGGNVTAHRLFSYPEPLAPVAAAARAGEALRFGALLEATNALPRAQVRLIEGAGGIAVPLDADLDLDWADFASRLTPCRVILVVEDRLGAINQARLLDHYVRAHKLDAGFWLHTIQSPPSEVAHSNREALAQLRTPLWVESEADVPWLAAATLKKRQPNPELNL